MLRRSKLEFYQDIIYVLAKRPLTIDGLAYESNTDCVHLQQLLDFLFIYGLVSIEITRDDKEFYFLTRRGMAISKSFSVTKRLEKLQANRQTESSQIAGLPEHRQEKIKRAK